MKRAGTRTHSLSLADATSWLLGGVAAAMLALGSPVVAQQTTAADRSAAGDRDGATEPSLEKVVTVEGITEYRLSNGLKVLLFPDPSKSTTTVNITYFVGSGTEGYGESGLAHLLEHMLFKGTPDHPNVPDEISEHGGRANGTTWFDRTNYFITFPAGQENLEWALDLEADRMVNSTLSEEDLESEMTVVRNEFEISGNRPFRILLFRVQAAAYRWHNYGNPTIGARSDIENVPVERLREFYRKYYQPDNAALIVAGKFEEDRVLELVKEEFGVIPKPERTGSMKIYPSYTKEPPQDGPKRLEVRRVGDNKHLMALYHVPPSSHGDYASVDLLSHVLADEPSGRLYEALVESGRASDVSAFSFGLKDPGMFVVSVEIREEDSLEEAEERFLAVMDSLRRNPPTEEEVERARNERLKQIRLLFNESQHMAINLSEWAASGDWRLFFLHRDRVKEVTAEAVAKVAGEYLVPSNRTVGVFLPTDEEPDLAEVPSAPDVEQLVTEYRGTEETAAGEAFNPTPENVERRVRRGTLESGFEYALLPKKSRGNSVNARLSLRFGNLEALRGEATAGDLAGDMLMRGTERLSRQEVQDRLNELQADVRVFGDVNSAGAHIETTRENFPETLRLVAEILREPAFEEEEFETLKDEYLASLESQRSRPTARASRAFRRALADYPPDHPSYTPTLQEELKSVRETSLRAAKRFHRRFYGAQGGTMGIVGDFDPERAEQILEEEFGDWTSEVRYQRIATPAQERAPEDVEIRIPDKPNAFYLAGTRLRITDSHPDYPALTMANVLLGGGFLNSRLAERLRQQDGVSYAVGSGFSAHPIDEDGGFTFYAMYAPQNKEKVEIGVREVLREALEEGFTEEEVERAKEGWLKQRSTSRSQDGSLAGALSNRLFADRTLRWDEALEERVSELTPEEIAQALREHLDPGDLTVVTAGSFEAATPGEGTGGGAGDSGGSGGR